MKYLSFGYLREHGFSNQATQNRGRSCILLVAYLLELLLSLPTVYSLSAFQKSESLYSNTIILKKKSNIGW